MLTYSFKLDFYQSSRAYKFYYHVNKKKAYLRHLEFYLKEGIADIVKNATLGHAFFVIVLSVCHVRTTQTALPVSAHILYSKKISVSESKS